jgi:multiple sugar transport system ATP-binding protein
MQRVALGRAMVRRPHVFLMDEPLSNLDAILRVETRAELKRLQRDLGTTTIYVTHDQEEAMTLADRLVVMRDGRAEQVGCPEEIYQRPRTMFVGRFIGSPAMNMLPCRYDAAAHELVSDTLRYPVPPALRSPLEPYAGAALTLGIRPEHITIHLEEQPASLPARVYVLEPLGRETLFTLALGETLLKVVAEPHLRPEPNQIVWLSLVPDQLHLFETDSGMAITG